MLQVGGAGQATRRPCSLVGQLIDLLTLEPAREIATLLITLG